MTRIIIFACICILGVPYKVDLRARGGPPVADRVLTERAAQGQPQGVLDKVTIQ